jgi:iron complex outermembrane receptor protein
MKYGYKIIDTTLMGPTIRRLWKTLWVISIGLSISITWAGLQAAENDAASEAALQDLLQVLDQETEIATKTKMNIDFVPGMVSVLYGDDLLARGFASAGEAMALIPGVELSLSSDGQSQVFVRGIGTAFSSGKVKVLLNGIPFNSTLSVATTALRLPVEQIDRIEVIRGPGSAIYGEFAFSGVINIVTRVDSNRVFARYGSLGMTTAGGVLVRKADERDLSMSLSFSGTWIDGDSVKTGDDVLRNSFFAGLSNAPGTSNEKEQDTSVIFQSKYRDTKLSVQFVKVDAGDYFGLAHALPSYGPKIMREVSFYTVNAETKWSLSPDLEMNAYMGWHDYKLDSGLHELYPAGTFIPGDFPNGVLGSPNYEERKYRAGADFNYKRWDKHDILAGVEVLYTSQGKTFAERNYDPNTIPPTPVPLAKYRGAENWLDEGLTRLVYGMFVQDQFSINDRLTMTAGLRFDSYDDVGNAFSPRVAAVYRLKENQTIKAQYAQAFRPPTFIETGTKNNPVVSGNPDIESERMTTYELAYIFNDEVNRLRATLYYADLHDLIVIDSLATTYVNQGEAHTRGLELEYIRNFSRQLKIDTSVSYMHPWNETAGETIADVAMVTGNIGVMYRPAKNYSVSAQYRYVGERQRVGGDPRSGLDGYQVIDLTVSAINFAKSGFDLRAGVKNIFDEKIIYPAPMVNFAASVPALLPAYEDDYPRPGREVWLQADMRF